MELDTFPGRWRPYIGLLTGLLSTILILAFLYNALFKRKPLHPNAPKLASGDYPFLGAIEFFTRRDDMFHREARKSKTGLFSFFVGREPVIGVTSQRARVPYFESHQLSLGEGQTFLFGATPSIAAENEDEKSGSQAFTNYFSKRLSKLLERDRTSKGLPLILKDTNARIQELQENSVSEGVTVIDPFQTIYPIIFQLTMRFVGCEDIVSDKVWLDKTLKRFNTIERSFGASAVLTPWFPTLSKIRRTIAGAQLYMDFQKIVDRRQKTGEEKNDPLQYLIDCGDNMTKIINFVLASLFAGQLNTGHNAAYVAYYLARNPEWQKKAREEVETAANKYAAEKDIPLVEKLSSLPISAWEEDFPFIDLCLRESIRLQLMGSSLRKNITNKPVTIGKEVVQPGAFVCYQFATAHLDPDVYSEPEKWDPTRYEEGREEDKKDKYAFVGWGAGRHPCLGMKTAKLEVTIMTAFLLAYFDMSASDSRGNVLPVEAAFPKVELNGYAAVAPNPPIYIRCETRK